MDREPNPFVPDTIHEIFKLVWSQNKERIHKDDGEAETTEAGVVAPKKSRATTANANALKLSCELTRMFVTEAIQRAAIVAEAEGISEVEGTHLERVLPQLLLDF